MPFSNDLSGKYSLDITYMKKIDTAHIIRFTMKLNIMILYMSAVKYV